MGTAVKQVHYAPRIVKRSNGHSAVAASAYRARCEMVDERTGDVYNYKHGKNDVLFEGVFTPAHAPDWMRDRHQLWNAVEKYEKRKDAQVAKDLIVSLSASLTPEQNSRVLKDFIRDNFTRKGFIVDVAMHKPDRRGDQRNIHAHLQISIRSLNKDGTWGGKEQFVKGQPPKHDLMDLKGRFTKRLNEELAKHGIDERWEYESLAKQGIDRAPTLHVGKEGMSIERDGQQTDRGDNLRLIREAHRLRRQAEKIEQEYANANAQARERANDDRPELPTKTAEQTVAAEVEQAQSAIDRMKAEERAEQIEALRAIGRNRFAAMGDQLREMFYTVRRLAMTMGATLGSIIKGGDFLTAKIEADHLRAVETRREAATASGGGRSPEVKPQQPTTGREDPLKVLERMAAERRAKRDREKEAALKRLRDGLPPSKPSRTNKPEF